MARLQSTMAYTVFWILGINVAVYMLQLSSIGDWITAYFSLNPEIVVKKLHVWQFFTYQFLHDKNIFLHIFGNMFTLVMFGIPVEREMGSRRFFLFYLLCGTGAGLFIFLISLITGGTSYYAYTLGASGAVFGVLVAFAFFFPDAHIYVFYVLPVKAKYLVFFYATFELYMEITGGEQNVSHLGHLGGVAIALIYLFAMRRRPRKFKFRGTENKTKIQKIYSEVRKLSEIIDPSLPMKKDILNKLINGATADDLTDDEWQFVKQLDILIEEKPINQGVAIASDAQAITDEQFISQVRKYISIN